ncbi:hypothetical protein HYS00_04590 [Candidatus Microgenomates bacterium]|nr:hypothetical protein [Candidatus Microgenomates bacterium]
MAQDNNLRERISTYFRPLREIVKQPPNGVLKYSYLSPAPQSVYKELWDWDAFFMGVSLTDRNPDDGIFLKNWALNYIINAQPDGKVPGCLTPEGYDPRLNHMKPFLAQGILIASKALNDFTWIKKNWDVIKKIVLYRESTMWNNKYDLAVWFDSMESGADNNVAAYRGDYLNHDAGDYPKKSIIAVDANAYTYQEYMSISEIASVIGMAEDSQFFERRAETVRCNMQEHLWSDVDGIFWNLDSSTGQFIKHVSFSCFVPLYAKLATQEQAKLMIENYLLSRAHMQSKFGLRTLSASDPLYNNINMLKPHSNWQGPIWPIANYIYVVGLKNYGYNSEAKRVSDEIAALVLTDLDKNGCMHEDYDAETGEPLAAPNFISWNLLVENMLGN